MMCGFFPQHDAVEIAVERLADQDPGKLHSAAAGQSGVVTRISRWFGISMTLPAAYRKRQSSRSSYGE